MRRSQPDLKFQNAFTEVKAVYVALAARPVQRACELRKECCQFKLTGRTPFLTLGEALLAAKGWRSTGRSELKEKPDGSCPMLCAKSGKCLIYESRPFGCRTHFCDAAGGPYARREVLDLIRRLESLDTALGGEGPRALLPAVQDALDRLT